MSRIQFTHVGKSSISSIEAWASRPSRILRTRLAICPALPEPSQSAAYPRKGTHAITPQPAS